ncbi:Thiol-disulfide isomerase or thioredoxin [Oryzisolibacter propanilivorax]|uniref:Thiol-disulfide isomerase or thioredoxin n=1 Tax=Oryzisolibacter propanilivorax TaxID=1527607 RepID=A0A1G9RNV1_9BURK|nr:TlpA disulfide reductase family protein [Oryzisolibacter propanilivorax]SDM24647.1 Thiol-disulfide isomerase or thioredoxin [Oryzisolibacter propanilivorax]
MNDTASPSTLPADARRRRWLLLTGAAAGLAGAGLAAWRLAPAPAAPDASAQLWSASFDGLDGRPLRMADLRGRPLLLNFWATWCPPCVQELPLLNRFHARQQARGWNLLALAVDQQGNVEKFLQRMPLQFPVALAGLAGSDLSRALGNERGGLPFSVLFAADGRILERKMGELTEQNLADWSALA